MVQQLTVHKFHRTTGSIGNRATPGKVLKQRKCQVIWVLKLKLFKTLKLLKLNKEKGYMLIKGSVPGSKNGFVRISKAIKK